MFTVGVGCSGGARMINGSSLGVLYLSRNYFHASRKDKSICQVGSKLRRSYRAGCTPLKTREEMKTVRIWHWSTSVSRLIPGTNTLNKQNLSCYLLPRGRLPGNYIINNIFTQHTLLAIFSLKAFGAATLVRSHADAAIQAKRTTGGWGSMQETPSKQLMIIKKATTTKSTSFSL